MRHIPIMLIYSRVVIGLGILGLSISRPIYFRGIIITLIAIGLLTDIFDGIIARRLGVSSPAFRRLDSGVDQIFWILTLISTYIIAPAFFSTHYLALFTIVFLEAMCYVVSFIRFKKEVATHAMLSKIWVLLIFGTLLQIIAVGDSYLLFIGCFCLGVISRVEIIVILFILPRWVNDVPSLYHAIQIKQGKEIKRSKWFNG